MAIIRQHDKRSGITYIYESTSYWDKAKKQPRATRKLIGRLDPKTGETVPTNGNCQRRSPTYQSEHPDEVLPLKPASQSDRERHTRCYGPTYLLDQAGCVIGVATILRKRFGERNKKLRSLAYYLVLGDKSSMSGFKKWAERNRHPYGKTMTSQEISELLKSITEEERMGFFSDLLKLRGEGEFWAYDITSISSYSKTLRQVRRGRSKENSRLPQINLALVFGQNSGMPFYYRKLPGNVPDVKTVKALLKDLCFLGYKKVKLVMDRGFYSEKNINDLYKERCRFLAGTKNNLLFVKEFIRKIGSDKDNPAYWDKECRCFMFSEKTHWDYSQVRPYKGDVLHGKKPMSLHLYFNPEKLLEEKIAFCDEIADLEEELRSGRRVEANEESYSKYFTVTTGADGRTEVTRNVEALGQAHEEHGFHCLISNDVHEPGTALRLYRNRNIVEQAFGNLKDRLGIRRPLVRTDETLDGKLFVAFIALMYLSFIKKRMEDAGMFRERTMDELFDELSTIECIERPGKEARVGEVLKKQEDLYRQLNVTPIPASPTLKPKAKKEVAAQKNDSPQEGQTPASK